MYLKFTTVGRVKAKLPKGAVEYDDALIVPLPVYKKLLQLDGAEEFTNADGTFVLFESTL